MYRPSLCLQHEPAMNTFELHQRYQWLVAAAPSNSHRLQLSYISNKKNFSELFQLFCRI